MSSPRPAPDPIYILRGLGAAITSLEFVPNGNKGQQRLISGDTSGVVSVWNLARKRTETTLNGHNSKSIINVRCLNVEQILSQARDGQVKIWNLTEGKDEVIKTIEVSDLGFCRCEILVDRVSIAVLGKDQSQVDVIDIKTMNVVVTLKPEPEEPLGMCMCLKNIGVQTNLIVAGYENGDIMLWNVQSSTQLDKLKLHKEPVMCMDFDTTTQRGVTGSAENILAIFQLTSEGKLVSEKTVSIKNPGISAVRIRRDSKILVTGGWDSKIRIFSWKALKPLAILNYHSKSVDALAFSECEEKLLAAGSKDGRISLWSLYKDN